jgi:hypothetical protein
LNFCENIFAFSLLDIAKYFCDFIS